MLVPEKITCISVNIPVDAVVLGCVVYRKREFFHLLFTKKSLSLVKDRTKSSESTCSFSVALATKKHRYFPGNCEAARGKAATPPIPVLCFHRNSMFLNSLLKSAANAVLKLMSAVIAIAHVLL